MAKRHLEFKQKLLQLLDEFPKLKSEFRTIGMNNLKVINTTFKNEEVQNWLTKFEELLKEEAAKPTKMHKIFEKEIIPAMNKILEHQKKRRKKSSEITI